MDTELFNYILRLGDDRLILGHRLSEWCGHGPILEEDIALGNIALDLLGQAQMLLKLAGEVEGKGRTEDDLAYLRDERNFYNLKLVEQPRGDFGDTIVRQALFDTYSMYLWQELCQSKHPGIAAIAAKSVKEDRYHLRHSSEWLVRLGDGTQESHERVQASLDEFWTFTGELFVQDQMELNLVKQGIVCDLSKVKTSWMSYLENLVRQATLKLPEAGYMVSGGRSGLHTEYLGHLLAELQILPRSYPGASW